MAYRARRTGSVLAIAVLAASLLTPFGCVAGGAYTEALPRPFDPKRWKAAQADSRCGMLIDLQYRVGVVGKTRQQLTALLGPDEDEDPDMAVSHWHLCPSFIDIWILEVRWQDDRAHTAWVRDT